MRNLLAKVPRSAQAMVAALVRSIFEQPDAEQVWAQHARIVEQLAERFGEATSLLIDAAPDVLAFTAFPKECWRQIRSNNPQERLNKELRRRTDVVGIFSDRAAVIRLVGAVLLEQHDEWAVVRPLHVRRGLGQGAHARHRGRQRGGGGRAGRGQPRITNEVDVVVLIHHVPGRGRSQGQRFGAANIIERSLRARGSGCLQGPSHLTPMCCDAPPETAA
jgi:hypothetical protein